MEKKKIIKKKATNSKKNKKKAFTLIELLAVIIILGILMVIAIPAVTTYIQNSRKSAYVATAKNIISAARTKVNDGTLSIHDSDTTYYLPYEMLKGENEWKSPYGDFEDAYVVVTFDGNGYDYYWTSMDTTNTGIYLTYLDLLDNDKVVNDMEGVDTTIGVGDRSKVVIYNDDGTQNNPIDALDFISEKESMEVETGPLTETSSNFFAFNESTKTIERLQYDVSVVIDDYNACANFIYEDGWVDTLAEADSYCRNDIEREMAEYPEDLEYLKENGAITSYNATKYPRNIVIPEEINGITVEKIDYQVFYTPNVETIVIPSTVKEVDFEGVDDYSNLRNIVNLTGKSFDWHYNLNSEEKVTFEFGVIPATTLSRQPIIVSDSKKKENHNFNNMFSRVITNELKHYGECNFYVYNVTLTNSSGYEVSYRPHGATDFIIVNDGATFKLELCRETVRISKNGILYFYGSIVGQEGCFC